MPPAAPRRERARRWRGAPDRLGLTAATIPAAIAASIAALIGLAACDQNAAQRTEENYCATVGAHLTVLSAPVTATKADTDRAVAAWRDVAATAPLAVQEEWDVIVANLVTAATIDPADAEALQRLADAARAAEPAADRLITYTQATCGITIASPAVGP